jgi:hypothetical protein
MTVTDTDLVKVDHRVVECVIYPTQFPSISELIANPKAPVLLTDKTFNATLTFTSENPVAGACKIAYFGQTDRPVFDNSTSLNVCIKQAFTVDSAAKRLVYDGPKQGEQLSIEINCSRWASALMHLVYQFTEREDRIRGTKPPFEVPEMRYVNVVLAVANNHKRDVYLLEEVIDGSEGEFRKYINNTEAAVLPQSNPDRQYVGIFLSFTQHVQMIETKQHVFVSDQQGQRPTELPSRYTSSHYSTGGLTLLSDPQIITSP